MAELMPIKATIIDDDAFRLLAIPYGGPIKSPVSPRGVDLDGEWFSERTDIKADWFDVRIVDWHHGGDPLMKREVIGKAMNLTEDEEGRWVDVWLQHGSNRRNLIKRLVERSKQLYPDDEVLYGSSESVPGMVKKSSTGEILVWPYVRQTLSTSPQNTHSVLRPLKAVIEGAEPTGAFWSDIEAAVRDLGADLRLTSLVGDDGAKAGRVLSTVNLKDLEDAIERLSLVVSRAKKEEAQAEPDSAS